MQHRILFFCLILSGFTGLSYELLWVRLLSASFGSTTLSFSTVLAVFFGGLALGSWLAARNLHRVRRPIRAYALIELITGVAGVVLYPVLQNLPSFFALIDPGPNLVGALTRFAVAVPILLVPTVLMGATLPLICAAMIRADSEIGRGTALIYGFNTLGAFLGVYLISYHMLHAFGVWRSILVTAGVNLVVFLIAHSEGRRAVVKEPPARDSDPQPASSAKAELDAVQSKLLAVATALTFLTGFSFICFEVVWARLFSLFLGGTIFGVGSVLICFLVGIALGSILIAPRADGVDAGRWFVIAQLVSAVGVLLATVLLPRVSYELVVLQARPDRATLVPQHLQLAVVLGTLALPTVASGAAFPLLVRSITHQAAQSGRSLGLLYSSNTVGSICGSLLTGFVLIPVVGSEATVYLGLLVTTIVAAIGAMFLMRGPVLGRAVAGLAALLALWAFPGLELQRLTTLPSSQSSYPVTKIQREQMAKRLIYFAEGASAVVTVAGAADTARGLQLNGLGQGSVMPTPPWFPLESALVAFVPLVHRPDAKNALVVGFGAGATVDLLARHGLERVTVLELESKVLDAAGVLFQSGNPLELPNVHVEVNDARHFLLVNERRGGEKFDLLTSMPAHPWVAAPIFTQEFFTLAKSNLTSNGVFSTWFGLGSMDSAALRSVVGAFVSVFEHHLVYMVPEAGAYFMVGSPGPIQLSTSVAKRLGSSGGFSEYPELGNPWFLPARVAGFREADSSAVLEGTLNTDDSAFIESHSPRSSTVPPTLGELLNAKFLPPEMFPPAGREHYLELMENLLGTPNGQISLAPSPGRLPQAKAALEGLGALQFGPADQAYLRGRLAALEKREGEALVHYSTAAREGDSVIRARARKFGSLVALKDPATLTNVLTSLSFSPDVAVRLLDLDRGRAVEYLRTSTTTIDRAGPVEWSLRIITGVDTDPRATPGSSELYARLREALGTSPPRGVAEECARFAEGVNLKALAHKCRALAEAAKLQQRNRLITEARSHGGAGRFEEARRALQTACPLDYGDLGCIRLWILSLIESGHSSDIERVLAQAELNHKRSVLEAVRAAAVATAAAGKSFADEPKPVE